MGAGSQEVGSVGIAWHLFPRESPLRDVVQAMGGEVWLTVDRAAASAALRLLLPPA